MQLWTTSNYHWYLKWELATADGDRPLACIWDPERFATFHLIFATGIYRKLDFAWCTDRSPNLTESGPAAVAVIDGRNILYTPFRFLVVPPPMAAATIFAGASVRQICFPVENFFDGFALLLADNWLEIYEEKESEKNSSPKNWQKNFVLRSRFFLQQNADSVISHLIWIDVKRFAMASAENLLVFETVDGSEIVRVV